MSNHKIQIVVSGKGIENGITQERCYRQNF